jgi:thioredoxin 1
MVRSLLNFFKKYFIILKYKIIMAVKVTDSNYKEFISTGVSLVDIWAQWCRPCLTLGPIIDELSNEYDNVKIGKLNADENSETPQQLGVRSIPTILIYKDGEIVERHVGGASKDQLKSLIDKHLN